MKRDLYKLLSLFFMGAIIVCCGEFEEEPTIDSPQLGLGQKARDSGYDFNDG